MILKGAAGYMEKDDRDGKLDLAGQKDPGLVGPRLLLHHRLDPTSNQPGTPGDEHHLLLRLGHRGLLLAAPKKNCHVLTKRLTATTAALNAFAFLHSWRATC